MKKDRILFVAFLLLGALGLSGFEFGLFDDRNYLGNISDVVQELKKAIR